MTEKARKLLADIVLAISAVERFLEVDTSFVDYQEDEKTKSAVERQLSIIGEAVNRYDKLGETLRFSNTSEIIGFRNRLIHAYDSLDDTIVWVIIKKYLPLLKTEAENFLNET